MTRIFYLVPPEHASTLLEPLQEHFAGEPGVEVLVERRTGRGEGRTQDAVRPRAPVAERDPARALPPDLRREAPRLRLVQPMEPLRRTYEDADMSELIERSLAADPDAVSELWWRISERMLTRLRLAIGVFAAERATSEMLGRVLDELPGYVPGTSLDGWLDRVVDRFCAQRLPAA
jgi:hypothetical protein